MTMLDPARNEITEGATVLSAKETTVFNRTKCQLHHDRNGSVVPADWVITVDNWSTPFAVCEEDSNLFVWTDNTTMIIPQEE